MLYIYIYSYNYNDFTSFSLLSMIMQTVATPETENRMPKTSQLVLGRLNSSQQKTFPGEDLLLMNESTAVADNQQLSPQIVNKSPRSNRSITEPHNLKLAKSDGLSPLKRRGSKPLSHFKSLNGSHPAILPNIVQKEIQSQPIQVNSKSPKCPEENQ